MRRLAAITGFMLLLASGAEAQSPKSLAHDHALNAVLYFGDAVDLVLGGGESKLPSADPSETTPLTIREMIREANLNLLWSTFWLGRMDCPGPIVVFHLSMNGANRAYLDFAVGDLPARSRYLNSLHDQLARSRDRARDGADLIRDRC